MHWLNSERQHVNGRIFEIAADDARSFFNERLNRHHLLSPLSGAVRSVGCTLLWGVPYPNLRQLPLSSHFPFILILVVEKIEPCSRTRVSNHVATLSRLKSRLHEVYSLDINPTWFFSHHKKKTKTLQNIPENAPEKATQHRRENSEKPRENLERLIDAGLTPGGR